MEQIPIEIWQIISESTPFLEQIRLRQVNKYFYEKLEIHDFYNIDDKYLSELSDPILINYPFIKYLNAHCNIKITTVNHMFKLEKLKASCNVCACDLHNSYCGITDEGLNLINLISLNACDNTKIMNINHMTKLKKLNASRNCGISNNGFRKLHLRELNAFDNYKITIIKHSGKLSKLNAGGYCGLTNDSIKYVNVKELIIDNNSNITNVNHMTKLKILSGRYFSAIDNNGIDQVYLEKLDIKGNPRITNVNHMTNLKILIASDNCGISDEGINLLENLEVLKSKNNKKITMRL